MRIVQRLCLFGASAALLACVTVNVYFPAAAAEKAADRFIKEVYGDDSAEPPASTTPATPGGVGSDEQSFMLEPAGTGNASLLAQFWQVLMPAAQAQDVNIDISTPAIKGLQSRMKQRHSALVPSYTAGALGMANSGLLVVRDPKSIGIRDRNSVKQLVAEENRDRNALYAEVAKANGHPEWEPRIRATFARRWIGNAPGGWWFQDSSGNWKQK